MSNLLFNIFGHSRFGDISNLVQQAQQFVNSFQGNAQQQIQQMLNSGKINQQMYDQAVPKANALYNLMQSMGIFK